jgi:hypothetical protein
MSTSIFRIHGIGIHGTETFLGEFMEVEFMELVFMEMGFMELVFMEMGFMELRHNHCIRNPPPLITSYCHFHYFANSFRI